MNFVCQWQDCLIDISFLYLSVCVCPFQGFTERGRLLVVTSQCPLVSLFIYSFTSQARKGRNAVNFTSTLFRLKLKNGGSGLVEANERVDAKVLQTNQNKVFFVAQLFSWLIECRLTYIYIYIFLAWNRIWALINLKCNLLKLWGWRVEKGCVCLKGSICWSLCCTTERQNKERYEYLQGQILWWYMNMDMESWKIYEYLDKWCNWWAEGKLRAELRETYI